MTDSAAIELAPHSHYTPQLYLRKTPLTLTLGLALCYIFSPLFQFSFGPLGYNDARVIELGIIALALFLFVLRTGWTHTIQPNPLSSWLWLGFFTLGWLSVSQAQYFQPALQELGLYAGLLLTLYVIAHELSQLSVKQRQALLAIIVISIIAIYAMQFLVYYLSQLLLSEQGMGGKIQLPNFQNQRSFNHTQAWLMPIACWAICWLTPRKRLYAITATLLLSLWWVILFYSNGRGILLSLVLASALGWIFFRPAVSPLLKPLLLSAGIGIGIYLLLFWVLPELLVIFNVNDAGELSRFYGERLQQTHSGGRTELWQTSLALITDHPWLGIGPQHFPYHVDKLGSPHNMAMAAMVELGIPSLLCLVLLIAVGLWQATRQGVKPSLLAGSLLSCTSVLIYSNLTGIGLTPVSQLLMLLIVGALMACTSTTTAQTKLNQVLWLILVVLACAALWISWQDLTSANYQLYVPGQNDPRFWLNGHYYHR